MTVIRWFSGVMAPIASSENAIAEGTVFAYPRIMLP